MEFRDFVCKTVLKLDYFELCLKTFAASKKDDLFTQKIPENNNLMLLCLHMNWEPTTVYDMCALLLFCKPLISVKYIP